MIYSRAFCKLPFALHFHNSYFVDYRCQPIDVLCTNFVKFGRREISEIVRWLPNKKFAWLCRSRYCPYRAQNLPGSASRSVFRG